MNSSWVHLLHFILINQGELKTKLVTLYFLSLLVLVGCNSDKFSMPDSFSPTQKDHEDHDHGTDNTTPEPPEPSPPNNLVTYTIVNGHGAAPWGSLSNPIRGVVGQVLRIVNNDQRSHQIHTDGNPFNHTVSIPSNTTMDFPLLRPITTGATSPSTYEHNFGPSSPIYFAVTAAP